MASATAPLETAPRRTIPFDYSFFLRLQGKPQRTANATVTVSVETPFVATGIGYGFSPQVETFRFGGTEADFQSPLVTELRRLIANPAPAAPALRPPTLNSITLGAVLNMAQRAFRDPALPGSPVGARTASILQYGFRFNPDALSQILLGSPGDPIDRSLLPKLFEVTPPVDEIQFLYALFDEGTGRAFQSEPILNTAGLGDARGRRPFRHFAVPITFSPMTKIRIEVTELQAIKGDLYVSLHGYKTLGGGAGPAAAAPLAPPPDGFEQGRRTARRRTR